jgi:asparagine synthase (glutamine-hydrolysing)
VIAVGDEFLTNFPRYAERSVYLTDGCVDVSRASDLYVSERARRIAPAKVVGTYGSEILTQIPTFKPVRPAPGLFSPDLQPAVEAAEERYAELRCEHPVTFAAFRQSPWSHYGVMSLEETQLSVRTPYLDNEFVRTVFRAPKSARADGDVRLRMIREGSDELGRIPTDRGVGGVPDGGLVPAVRRGLLEFTFKAEHAFDYAMPQWLARLQHRCSPLHLERIFLGRHKLLHFRVWYQTVLSRYVRDVLLDPRALARPYIDRRGLEAIVQGHLEGGRNYTTEIHKLVTLELIHRLFIDER